MDRGTPIPGSGTPERSSRAGPQGSLKRSHTCSRAVCCIGEPLYCFCSSPDARATCCKVLHANSGQAGSSSLTGTQEGRIANSPARGPPQRSKPNTAGLLTRLLAGSEPQATEASQQSVKPPTPGHSGMDNMGLTTVPLPTGEVYINNLRGGIAVGR